MFIIINMHWSSDAKFRNTYRIDIVLQYDTVHVMMLTIRNSPRRIGYPSHKPCTVILHVQLAISLGIIILLLCEMYHVKSLKAILLVDSCISHRHCDRLLLTVHVICHGLANLKAIRQDIDSMFHYH